MPAPETCLHCNLPIVPADLVIDRSDGVERHFCCNGCRGAYRIISGAGLGDFYRRRDWDEQGVPQAVFETDFDDRLLAGHVSVAPDGLRDITFLVEGVRCATCIWLLEKILGGAPGVSGVRVNYGTHRAQVRFDPEQTTPAELFRAVSRLGYLPHPFTASAVQQAAAREQKTLLLRFGTAAFLSLQLMGYSFALYGGYFHGIDPGIRRMLQAFAAVVTTPVVFYSGWPFLAGAWRNLRNRVPGMDLLVALGVLSAYLYSLYAVFSGGEVYFDTAAMIVTLILLGRLLEGAARNRSLNGIDRLLKLAPDTATLVEPSGTRQVDSVSLQPEDLILVRPGERVPVDCRIVAGASEFDESTISGEPLPVLRAVGDEVRGGTLNRSASVTLAVARVAAESFVARMARMVEDAQQRKAPIQSLADRVATWFVPFVLLTAGATWGTWRFIAGEPTPALLHAVAVLVVACPCALGLATPTAVLAATGRAAARGILFRGGDVLEQTAHVDLVAFDKTGTLTVGQPTVAAVIPAAGTSETDLLELAMRLESGSNHPLALGIAERAAQSGISLPPAHGVETVPGRGLRLQTADGELLLGSRRFLEEHGVDLPGQTGKSLTEVCCAENGLFRGQLLIHDPLRADAATAVSRLHAQGVETALLTGDHRLPAEAVARTLEVGTFACGMGPADKSAWLEQARAAGRTPLMIGDGINDAPALSTAAVGCSMAGGTDIALDTADLVLTRPEPSRLAEALVLARRTLRVIRQNLFWAFAYNLVAIPLAASGRLAPIWAAAAMALSSVLVVGNSLRLGRGRRRDFAVEPESVND